MESKESLVLFHLYEGEITLRKWMMDRDTLGYSRQRDSKNLGELVSGDYLTFSALIWHKEKIRSFFFFNC